MDGSSQLHQDSPSESKHAANDHLPESPTTIAPETKSEVECRGETASNGGASEESNDSSDTSIRFENYEGRDLSEEYWGPTRDISAEALTSLAKSLIIGKTEQSCTLLSRKHGVYNSGYILEFDDGEKVCIRVPACAWGNRWNEKDKELLRSTALMLRMLEKETPVPTPEVITFDVSFDNGINAPYILMRGMAGSDARRAWTTDTGPVPKETRRQNILKDVAQAMAGLRHLQFPKSGSHWFAEDEHKEPVIGETWNLRTEGYIIKRDFVTMKPYSSTREKVLENLRSLLDEEGFPDNCQDFTMKGVLELYRLITEAFLDATDVPESDESFVLMHCDFDIQNIMVDSEGHLIGILDWDGVSAQPHQMGWSMVPFWLQNDWSPGYQWPPGIGANYTMVRPDEFDKYRQDYARYMWEACGGKGDCRFTSKSHIYRAFLGSADRYSARRFVENVLADILPRSRGLEYCTKLGEYGFRSGEKEWLEPRLRIFFKPEAPVGATSVQPTTKLWLQPVIDVLQYIYLILLEFIMSIWDLTNTGMFEVKG